VELRVTKSNPFQLTDRRSCEQAIRSAATVAVLCGGAVAVRAAVDLAGALAGLSPSSDAVSAIQFFASALVFAGLGVWLYRTKMRAAALVLFTVYIAGVCINVAMARSINPLSVVVVAFFVGSYTNALRATFLWHDAYRDGAPHPPPPMPETTPDVGVSEPEAPRPSPRSDLCSSCFEFLAPDEQVCNYCGTVRLAR